MKLKTILFMIITGIYSIFPIMSYGAEVFRDSFESEDMSATNPDGFAWDGNNGTSIVVQDPVDGPVRVFENFFRGDKFSSLMGDGSIRDWTAKDAGHSMRFNYLAGKHWVEQRYYMGKGYPELWVSYWMRVPHNYVRNTGPFNQNNKWFNIQMGPMSLYTDKTVSRVEMQDWPGAGKSMSVNIQYRNGTDYQYKNSNTYTGFVKPSDAGRWMHLVYHFKVSSAPGATDGIIRMYRRWSSEADYTLINDLSNINVGIGASSIATGNLGWAGGYIMGYANVPYSVDTEWLLDDFTMSTTSLFADGPKVPKAPSSLAIY